jgi:hypothetical protein
MASQVARTDESATGWDQHEGFIDPTNTDKYTDLTSQAYVMIWDGLSGSLGTPNALVGLERMRIPQTPSRLNWLQRLPFPLAISNRTNIFDQPHEMRNIVIYSSFSPPNDWTETEVTDNPNEYQWLYQQLEDEISKLEQDIHSSLRGSVRHDLDFLLLASIQEHGQDNELLTVRSVRGLYRFLSKSQCTAVPVLSLTADGNVYARWRESRNRSIGALFQNGSSVDYALRNLPKKHGGTTSPAEFWSQIKSLGFIDLIRRTEIDQAA